MAENLEGYAGSVDANSHAIFEEAGLTLRDHERLSDQFVFAAAIRRLWSLVDSQFWILSNSLNLLEQQDIASVRLGNVRISRGSTTYREVRDLRESLQRLLRELEVYDLTTAESLPALAQQLALRG